MAINSVFILILIIVLIFVIYMFSNRSNYSHNHPILNQIRANFEKLNPEYGKIPLREGDSAYTENKSVITLCLKNPTTGNYYDMNTLMYVAIHELAHMVSETHGHNDEFKANFKSLLQQAARKRIYDPKKEIPNTYCGVGPN